MPISAYAACAMNQALVPFEYESRELTPWDVEIEITHCGICHSDLDLIQNSWGDSAYPLVPGHEIVGIVKSVGQNAGHLHKGQRVGLGWQCASCFSCEWCLRGEENLCPHRKATCINQYGGFANAIVTDSRFVFAIPDSLESAGAAPLFCAGATVFSPLLEHTRPTMHVGIIGMGGLGHLAIQFAHAFGCEVTVFSSHADKEADAKAFGADHFISTLDKRALRETNPLDFILSTAPANLDWESYLTILKPKGSLCFVGIIPGEIRIKSADSLINGRKKICGSNMANRQQIESMLMFAADHQIRAKIEAHPLSAVNVAIERMKSNQVHYRAVLEMGA